MPCWSYEQAMFVFEINKPRHHLQVYFPSDDLNFADTKWWDSIKQCLHQSDAFTRKHRVLVFKGRDGSEPHVNTLNVWKSVNYHLAAFWNQKWSFRVEGKQECVSIPPTCLLEHYTCGANMEFVTWNHKRDSFQVSNHQRWACSGGWVAHLRSCVLNNAALCLAFTLFTPEKVAIMLFRYVGKSSCKGRGH